MRIVSILFIALILSSCSKSYKPGDPLTGDELLLAQKAAEMERRIEELDEKVSPSLEQWKGFVENVKLFNNNCHRFSCNSLEARNDFNRLRYYAVQLDQVLTKEAYPNAHVTWMTIRKDYVDAIGKELGYRIGSEQ